MFIWRALGQRFLGLNHILGEFVRPCVDDCPQTLGDAATQDDPTERGKRTECRSPIVISGEFER